jgi:hypothetical protein
MDTLYSNVTNSQIIQVLPLRDVSDQTFALGQIQFDVDVGDSQLLGSGTYFSMQVQLTKNDDVTPILTGDDLAPVMDLPAALFDSVEYRINGQLVCSVNEFPQCDFLDHRIVDSSNKLDTLEDILIFTNPDPESRRAAIAASLGNATPDNNQYLDVIFQPLPLRQVFRAVNGVVGAGKHSIIFYPSNNYKTKAIQTNISGALVNTPIFKVNNLYLNAEVKTASYSKSLNYKLTYPTMRLMKEPLFSGNVGFNTKNFMLSPKCKAVTIAFQATDAGYNTEHPITHLGALDYAAYPLGNAIEKNLQQLQLNYLGQDYTPNLYNINQTYTSVPQIKKDTSSFAYFNNVTQFDNNPVPESENFWSLRGQFYHFKLYNPKEIKNSNLLTVKYKFSALPVDMTMLVFEHNEEDMVLSLSNGSIRL